MWSEILGKGFFSEAGELRYVLGTGRKSVRVEGYVRK